MPSYDPTNPDSEWYLHLTETHELQESLRDQVWETQPPDLINEVQQLIAENGIRRTLTQLYTHQLLQHFAQQNHPDHGSWRDRSSPGMDITPEEDPGLPPKLTLYAGGLAMGAPSTEHQNTHTLRELAKPLLTLLNWFSNQQTRIQMSASNAQEDLMLRAASALSFRELTTHRHANGIQMHEKGYRFYKPWEEEMQMLLGFSIEDALYYSQQLVDDHVETIDPIVPDIAKTTESLLEIGQEGLDIAEGAIWYSQSDLEDLCDDTNRFQGYLQRLSNEPDPDSQFVLPSDTNPLHVSPIPNIDGEYMTPFPRTVQNALANTFYFDLIGSDYSGEFGDSIGEVLENWGTECLQDVFDSDSVYTNVEYEIDGDPMEADILVKHEDTVLVWECKSKRLTAQTKQGSHGGERSLNTIRDDVDASIGTATRQAHRLCTRLEDGEVSQLESSTGERIEIHDEVENCYRCVLLSESYGDIATRLFNGVLDLPTTPYVCDIYDLQVITNVIDRPEIFTRYVKDRIKLTEAHTHHAIRRVSNNPGQHSHKRIRSSDEIDYLAVYRRNNNQFPLGADIIMGAGDPLREEAVTEIVKEGDMEFIINPSNWVD